MTPTVLSPEGLQRVSVRVWAKHIDAATERQLRLIASQPYVLDPVCAMADAHLSNHVAVGTVFATEHTVVPDALGGDLGCGIAVTSLNLSASALDDRSKRLLHAALLRTIPVGDAVRPYGVRCDVSDALSSAEWSTRKLARDCARLVSRHLGTLGGGNHFIELARAPDDQLWAMVHTGSRGVGAAAAAHHRAASFAQAGQALGGLDIREPAGMGYLRDLQLACEFARANRRAILTDVRSVIGEMFSLSRAHNEPEAFDVEHNTAVIERHDGQDVLVHRKGATAARDDQLGVIPGSMGTASYIVRGKANPQSWCSCSHGAGRVLSRRQAHEQISVRELERQMRHVYFDRQQSRQLVDEAPSAYRDIREVIAQQESLITPVLRLEPVLSVKGVQRR